MKKEFTLHRVIRTENVSDIPTHKVSARDLGLALHRMSLASRPVAHKRAPVEGGC